MESGFGGCSFYGEGNCDGSNTASDPTRCYLQYRECEYWTLLDKHGFLHKGMGMASERTCLLAAHYQFFREALFAIEKRGDLVVLTDHRSSTFYCTGPFGERGPFAPPEKLHTQFAQGVCPPCEHPRCRERD
jgi:hypothetical protein